MCFKNIAHAGVAFHRWGKCVLQAAAFSKFLDQWGSHCPKSEEVIFTTATWTTTAISRWQLIVCHTKVHINIRVSIESISIYLKKYSVHQS